MENRNNIRYIDNPENGTTVAIMGEEMMLDFDAVDIIEKLIENNSRYLALDRTPWSKTYEELTMKSVYKGVSKCNMVEDTYDKELGRKYAFKKCKEKYEASKDKRLIRFLVDLWRLTEAVEEYLVKRGILEYCDEPECPGDCELCETK